MNVTHQNERGCLTPSSGSFRIFVGSVGTTCATQWGPRSKGIASIVSATYHASDPARLTWASSAELLATYKQPKSHLRSEEDEFSEYELYDVPNWDGYGAAPISKDTVRAARSFARLLPRDIPRPDVAPGADGTIGFEWRVGPFSARGLTLVDIGPGDLITARQVREEGSVHKFPQARLNQGDRDLVRQLFPQ